MPTKNFLSLEEKQFQRILKKNKYVYIWSKYSLEEKQDKKKRELFKEKLEEYIRLSNEKLNDVITRHLDTDHWQIIVEDNGGGIPAAIKQKLFEPFVTSKADTDGIGLGLWISREMMTNFIKGEIYGESEGEKTKFSLNVPFFPQ